MALKIPHALKLTHLKSLAFQCGISTSGTKAALTNRLINEVVPILPSNGCTASSPIRILSIDMGIRNLAYCVLDLPKVDFPKTQLPTVLAWRRIAVSSPPVAASSMDNLKLMPPPKEAFDPPTLSAAAYRLLHSILLPYKPTHILIERQRFRSMGGPRILEWTVRVNMFESMLYAVLQTLKSEKLWEGMVIPITPGKVGPFWVDPELGKLASETSTNFDISQSRQQKTRTTKNAKLLNKGAKMDLVKRWISENEMVEMGTPEAKSTAKAYLEKWHRLPGCRKPKSVPKGTESEEAEEVGKLDDLADSLLQGMAWVRWEENKVKVLKSGVEVLSLC